MRKDQLDYNRNFKQKAQAEGRCEVRVMLDPESSKTYAEMKDALTKKEIGNLFKALVQLGEEAKETGRLKFENGKVIFH
ncbi:hypothetical protein [Enterovibrio paralichthyis]|uniref:hypothetical protein n=1 Tax=Enterovibrio paralichthyis TaxID=2853805 RepID=UPI001C470FDB|nr:hypothetical protein [Enterovibrio paralichthyis]MBV7300262.1 hypothetical protein [Enterovibrio paralichthyis]